MDYIFKSSSHNQCFQGKLHQIANLAVKSSSCIFLILLLLINNLPVQSQRHKGRNFNGAALSALIDISKGYSASSPPLDGTSLSASIIGGDLRRNTVLKEIPSPALGLNDIINQAENTVRRRIEELEPSILSSGSTNIKAW